MKQAVTYTRVSTESQATDGVSLDNQRDRIRAYAAYKEFEIVEEIEDAGISGGKNRAREGFMRLLDIVQSGDVDAVIFYSLDRLSRDMLTLLSLALFVDEYDVTLHTIDGDIDTSTPDGFMAFAMKAFLGEMERRQVKYRTKKAMEHKRGHNQVFNHVPYGYDRAGKELVPNLAEQAVIRDVNERYQAGTRLVDIVDGLNARGVTTKKGGTWTPQQVKNLIEDYHGKFKKAVRPKAHALRAVIEAIA